MKKELKKKITHNKNQSFKITGGGVPKYIDLQNYEKLLVPLFSVNLSGMESQNDSDSLLPITGD